MNNKIDTIIVKVLPYNKKYDNTKNLSSFKEFLINSIKKEELDTRARFIWGKDAKVLPTGS
jgi:hypothetical protein